MLDQASASVFLNLICPLLSGYKERPSRGFLIYNSNKLVVYFWLPSPHCDLLRHLNDSHGLVWMPPTCNFSCKTWYSVFLTIHPRLENKQWPLCLLTHTRRHKASLSKFRDSVQDCSQLFCIWKLIFANLRGSDLSTLVLSPIFWLYAFWYFTFRALATNYHLSSALKSFLVATSNSSNSCSSSVSNQLWQPNLTDRIANLVTRYFFYRIDSEAQLDLG